MAYTEKFQHLADAAMSQVASVSPEQVNELLAQGAVALDIRDKEEHDAGWTASTSMAGPATIILAGLVDECRW